MKKSKIYKRLSYSSIFSKKDDNILSLIGEIDKNLAIEFLVLISKAEKEIIDIDKTEIDFIIQDWLIFSDVKLKKKVALAYTRNLNDNELRKKNADFSEIRIINNIATLRTLEIFLSKEAVQVKSQSKSRGNKEFYENIFRLYLLVNTEIEERQNKVFEKYFVKNNLPEKEIKLHLFLGLSHVEMFKPIMNLFFCQVLKLIIFEKWLRMKPEFDNLIKSYQKSIKVENWYNYFNDVFQINNLTINNIIFELKDQSVLKPLLDYYSDESDKDSVSWNEFLNIKRKPLYKLDKSKYLVLDNRSVIEKMFNGVYHDLVKLSIEEGFKNYHQMYSKEFAEEYLFCNVLENTFGKHYIKYSEKEILLKQKRNDLALPDYYVRNGNKIFLFEFKNSFISNEKKVKFD